MNPRARQRRLAVALGCLVAGAIATRFVSLHAGILDHRICDYYQGRIVSIRGIRKMPSRLDFMRPYSSEIPLFLRVNHLLDGYHGTDLNANAPLTRYEIAYLLGRFIRLVNSRDGTVFPRDGSVDHQPPFFPQKGWGFFELEDALSERILIPLWELGWWERPLSRYDLAPLLAKMIKRMAHHYTVARMFEVYPANNYADFIQYGHPRWFLCRVAIETGLLQADGGRFRGEEPVRGHDMSLVLDRLVAIADGYERSRAKPLPEMSPEGSGLAMPRPDPFPDALRTLYHTARQKVDDDEVVKQRPVQEREVREPRLNMDREVQEPQPNP